MFIEIWWKLSPAIQKIKETKVRESRGEVGPMLPPPIRTLSVSPKTELIIHPTSPVHHPHPTPNYPRPYLTLTQLLLQNTKVSNSSNSFSLLSFFIFPKPSPKEKERRSTNKLKDCSMVDSPISPESFLVSHFITFPFQLFFGEG